MRGFARTQRLPKRLAARIDVRTQRMPKRLAARTRGCLTACCNGCRKYTEAAQKACRKHYCKDTEADARTQRLTKRLAARVAASVAAKKQRLATARRVCGLLQ